VFWTKKSENATTPNQKQNPIKPSPGQESNPGPIAPQSGALSLHRRETEDID